MGYICFGSGSSGLEASEDLACNLSDQPLERMAWTPL